MAKNCIDCTRKLCKESGIDCYGLKESSLNYYSLDDASEIIIDSAKLVDNGKAGTLSRMQEVIEYCHLQQFNNVGIAYCFGLESVAKKVRDYFNKSGISTIPARCTMGGIKESEIDISKNNHAISCNPAGQAHFLNSRADFVVELGLCLGHDVMFHQELKVPFTVLLVKDRVYSHNPLKGINDYHNK